MRRAKLRSLGVAFALLAAPGLSGAQVPAELLAYPNLVIVNAKVLTVDQQFTVAEAVAMRDGKILAVGTTEQIRRLVGPSTRVVDAGGKSVVPGFIASDGDNSFAGGDLYKDTMVNGKVGSKITGSSVPEMLDKVRALLKEARPGSPAFFRMADEFVNDFAKLTIKDADALAPNNPRMMACSSSEGLVNAAMLQRALAAGLPRNHIGIVKDASGNPTGQLFSTALGMVGWNLRDWPELTEDVFKQQEEIN